MRIAVVGNDVVDVLDPRTFGKARDERFVARVLDAEERAALGDARDAEEADLELWCRWAAKEAAYKVVSKLAGAPPPFVHRAYAARWDEAVPAAGPPPTGASPGARAPGAAGAAAAAEPSTSAGASPLAAIRCGHVRCEGRALPVVVRVQVEGGRAAALHAVATSTESAVDVAHELAPLDLPGSPWTGPLDELRSRLSERELDAARSLRSAAVRLGARAFLARRTGIAEERIEIVCDPGVYGRRPPRVRVDGAVAALDVSLSHDGRWIGWAVWTGDGA